MQYIRFWGDNGYAGTEYEYYELFDDDATMDDIEQTSTEYAYDNAETYEYVSRGWGSRWYSEEDKDRYYENALEHCGWDYCSSEEYKAHIHC